MPTRRRTFLSLWSYPNVFRDQGQRDGRGDGKELFYHAPDGKLLAVPVESGATFEIGVAVPLFEFRTSGNVSNTYYDVTRDGRRFLLSTIVEAQAATPFTVVMNWAATANKNTP
mgnify:CR=1 FL=1